MPPGPRPFRGPRRAVFTDPDSAGEFRLAFSTDGSTLAVGDANANTYRWNMSWLVWTFARGRQTVEDAVMADGLTVVDQQIVELYSVGHDRQGCGGAEQDGSGQGKAAESGIRVGRGVTLALLVTGVRGAQQRDKQRGLVDRPGEKGRARLPTASPGRPQPPSTTT